MLLPMRPSGSRPSAPPPLGAGLDAPDVEPTAEPRVSGAWASLARCVVLGLNASLQSQQGATGAPGVPGPTPEVVGGLVAWERRMLRSG